MIIVDKTKIGKIVKEIRVSNNLSQKDLANKFNVKQETISQIELGKIAPSLDIINQYISNFSIKYEDLFGVKNVNNTGNVAQNNKNSTINQSQIIAKDEAIIADQKKEIQALKKRIKELETDKETFRNLLNKLKK